MILTNNTLVDVAGLKGIYELIQKTCESHIAVSEHKVGYDLTTDTSNKNYPLTFLESNINSEVEGSLETFHIALSIADRLPNDYDSADLINTKAKIDQILSEIHYKFENVACNVEVSGLDKMHYDDVNEDVLAVIRGELSITIPRYTANDAVALDVPEFGTISHIIYSTEFNTTLGVDTNITHSLNSLDITAQFYLAGERVTVDYTIVDANTIKVNTDESLVGLDVVILAAATGSISKYSALFDLAAGVSETIEHGLNNSRILAQFYHNRERVEVDYSISNKNGIIVTSNTDYEVLKVVVMASDIAHIVNTSAGVSRVINHNLNTDDIQVQFYLAGENIVVDYTITDLNNITIKTDSNITGLTIVIFR
jgi:hypothetical protein